MNFNAIYISISTTLLKRGKNGQGQRRGIDPFPPFISLELQDASRDQCHGNNNGSNMTSRSSNKAITIYNKTAS